MCKNIEQVTTVEFSRNYASALAGQLTAQIRSDITYFNFDLNKEYLVKRISLTVWRSDYDVLESGLNPFNNNVRVDNFYLPITLNTFGEGIAPNKGTVKKFPVMILKSGVANPLDKLVIVPNKYQQVIEVNQKCFGLNFENLTVDLFVFRLGTNYTFELKAILNIFYESEQ